MSSKDKVKLLSNEVLDEITEEAWLGFDTTKIKIPDDLGNIWKYDEPPGLVLARYIRKPENFGFLCSEIFNVKLMPFQLAFLKEIWNHKFPMLIASRGCGKCITGDSIVISKGGLFKISDLVGDITPMNRKYLDSTYLLGENGFNKVEYAWSNGESETIEISTHNGYTLEGTVNHPVRIIREGKITWVDLAEVKLNDYIPIYRSPDLNWEHSFNMTEDEGWFLGAIVGDGGYTVRGRISFTSADEFMHDETGRIAKDIFGKEFSDTRNGEYSKQLYGVDIWDKFFTYYGFNSSSCELKDIPSSIYKSSKAVMGAFLSGLFDTDGCFEKNKTITLSAKSKSIIQSIQKLLLVFGIVSRIKSKYNKKYNRNYYHLSICGYENILAFHTSIGFRLKRKSELVNGYLNSGIKPNTNLDIIPHELALEHTLKLRERYYALSDRPRRAHDESDPFSSYNLKLYQLSYKKLRSILEYFSLCKDSQEWIFLNELCDKHYYYDKVTKISAKTNVTYDVHIPNDHSFISNGFISHNSFLLSLYSMLKAFLYPDHKVVVAGAGYRQSKHLFEYTKAIWARAPVLRSLAKGSIDRSGPHSAIDRCLMQICDSRVTFLPIGGGGQIRGERAHTLIVDEFSVLPLQIYEVVLKGFTSTSSDPVGGAIEYRTAEILKERYGIEMEKVKGMGNQSIISGTCDYDFQHFAAYWKRYKQIIYSKGDQSVLQNVDIGMDESAELNSKDFSIIRYPVNLIPKGFMDAGSISSAKATMHSSAYLCEYGACFAKDSDGFFKRSLLESCVIKPDAPEGTFPEDAEVFEARVIGNPERKYVYGIDPASETDNFSIVILELHQKHTRIVYCWTTSKKEHKAQLRAKLTTEQSFYAYVVRKVRQLMRTFPPALIGCDSQGGGVGVREAFYDQAHIEKDEVPIFPIPSDDPKKPNDTDLKHGLHIVDYVNFAKADWVTEANNYLRKDFESKALLFPFFDTASLEMAVMEDEQLEKEGKLTFDTLENCIWEIEELKSELATIVETKTASEARSRWDTPEIKLPNSKKGRMKKDRYSALLIANMVAHGIQRAEVKPEYKPIGGFINRLKGKEESGQLFYTGPELWVTAAQDFFS